MAGVFASLLEAREHAVDVFELPAAALARGDAQVFLDGEQAEDPAVLRHQRQPLARNFKDLLAHQRLAVEVDLALARADDAEDAAQRGGLAGAVAAEQGHQFAGVDGQRYTFEHVALVIVGMDILDDQHQAASPR
ncbi:hypothetical protein SDC9_201528 [bioreactor metagenome]|uniref:Uncharacterized protein n=1 Tax=bioreactor metagenome TaxID=1076179 RepID=A0A645ISE9_9ZZZZ